MNKKTQQEIDNLSTDTQLLHFIAKQTAKSQEHLSGIRNMVMFMTILIILGGIIAVIS